MNSKICQGCNKETNALYPRYTTYKTEILILKLCEDCIKDFIIGVEEK